MGTTIGLKVDFKRAGFLWFYRSTELETFKSSIYPMTGRWLFDLLFGCVGIQFLRKFGEYRNLCVKF